MRKFSHNTHEKYATVPQDKLLVLNLGFLYKMTNTEYGYNLVANVRKKLMTKIVCRGLGPSPVHNTLVKLVEGNAEIVLKDNKH